MDQAINIQVNEYQTQITNELLSELPKEIIDELIETINSIPFVQRLISPDRKRAIDLPRDEKGRIIVDICNPHILEDMDYFRETAIHFQKHGCYTKLKPDGNPRSEFGKWLKREIRRCWYGMLRPTDGEWITGNMYFYLNYFPIIQTKKVGKKKGIRIVDMPEMWEGVYWRFHYMDQARHGGIYDIRGGMNGCEIARRGASKSYSIGSVLSKCFVLGVSQDESKKVRALMSAYQKEFLIKDGTLNKFEDGINHCAKTTQFPSQRIRSTLTGMEWIAGFIENNGQVDVPKGSENQVLGISIKDDPDKIRGKRSAYVFHEELKSKLCFIEI